MHSRSSSTTDYRARSSSPIDYKDLFGQAEVEEEKGNGYMTPPPVDWVNFTGPTPDFPGQRTAEAWKEGRARRRAELAEEERDIIIISSPSPVIKVKDESVVDDERQQMEAAEEKREIIIISSSPPNSPVIKAEDDDRSSLAEIDDREMIAPVGAEGVDQPHAAVSKRKRDISTNPVENRAEGTNVGVPHKKRRVSKVVKVRVPTNACSIKVVVKFNEGDAE